MKEKILACKALNPTWGYKKIGKFVGCAPNLVRYHVDPNQKEKVSIRSKKSRKINSLTRKVETFLLDGVSKRVQDFLRKTPTRKSDKTFSTKEFREKLGPYPKCYLTGQPINLSEPKSYALDHIIPRSKGGDNSLCNAGLTTKKANAMKSNIPLKEFLQTCKMILENHGFTVSPN